MTYSISITEDDVCAALRTWLIAAIGCEVVRGLSNRVPMPLGGFIVMTPGTQQRLSTNIVEGFPADLPIDESQGVTQHVMQGIQLDLYGANAGDWAGIISTLWRDTTTCDALENIQPLHNSEPLQMSLVDGEQQYEERWIIKVYLQYNATVTLNQSFFKGVSVELIDVDATIH